MKHVGVACLGEKIERAFFRFGLISGCVILTGDFLI